jgi:hypothetical protein
MGRLDADTVAAHEKSIQELLVGKRWGWCRRAGRHHDSAGGD